MGGNQEKKYNRISKRVLRCFLPALLILALFVPVLLAVPVSAADYTGTDDINLISRFAQWNGSSWVSTYSVGNSVTFNNSTPYGAMHRAYLKDSIDGTQIQFPVGKNLSNLFISASLFLDGDVSSNQSYLGFQLLIDCYDSSGTKLETLSLGRVFSPGAFEKYQVYLSFSGLEFPSGTAFFQFSGHFGGIPDSASFTTTGNLYGMYGSFVSSIDLLVHTSEIDWHSSGYSRAEATSSWPFVFSHDGQDVYTSVNDDPVLLCFAIGFSSELDIDFLFLTDGGVETFDSEFDSTNFMHYQMWDVDLPLTDSYYPFTITVLINGTSVYTFDSCTIYGPLYSGGSSGDSFGNTSGDVIDKLEVIDSEIGLLSDQIADLGVDINTGFDNLGNRIEDALNPTDPELDEGMAAVKDDMASIKEFEDQYMNDLEEYTPAVLDQFNVFQTGSTLLTAFNFVSMIVQNTFSSLGMYQVVLTLPIALGIFLFICSRVRGEDRPRKENSVDNDYLRDSHDFGGPKDHRDSVFYDADRDKSPL